MWGQEEQRPQYGSSNYGGPPQQGNAPIPPPWVQQFDSQSQRWYFLNQQTGERRWDFPPIPPQQQQYQQQQPPPQQQFYNGPPNESHGGQYPPSDHQGKEKKGHGSAVGWGLAGAAAGLAGGALLMHEGHEIKEDWEEGKYNASADVNDAAYWAGQKVQDVEDIPQDIGNGFDRLGNRIEQGFDNTVDYVEDAPDRIAENVGEAVGEAQNFGDRVEDFGDGLQDSYEDGRDDARDDDDGW